METTTPAAQWLQHTHLAKLYGYLPGLAAAQPAIFGLEPDEYGKIMNDFAAAADGAAEQLLDDAAFAAQVDALPFRPGQTVLAVGDSQTDDSQSWAEILRGLLDRRKPDVKLINGGLSAHTTSMILRRWPATLAATKPDWILCLLGGNDVTRVGPDPVKTQVGLDESLANLRELRRIAAARTSAGWVWLTPVPVDEDRVAAYPPFRFGESTWRNDDLVAFARAMRDLPDPLVDLTEVFGVPADPALQGPDGVHVNLAGQSMITRVLVERLATP
ncbi:SGNH/GDSL hydrolase family protein [Microlunatus speluncae]|uniref:SGNH/GDSL hydrolase family protein n=1 Tax=Microlunatus speluncae TaxID=2594267 RepID=UPI00137628B6|nr:GDSL-type esterase/lipase family protein [Microlunatus speluncae]